MFRLAVEIEMDTDNYEAVLHLQEHIHRILASFPMTRFAFHTDQIGVDPAAPAHNHTHNHTPGIAMAPQRANPFKAVAELYNTEHAINEYLRNMEDKHIPIVPIDNEKKDFLDEDEMEL